MGKIALLAVLFLGTANAQIPAPTLPTAYINTTWNAPTAGVVWQVHQTADLQPALDSAQPGDVIVMDAGVTYLGNFTLRAKSNPGNKWIYVESARLSGLPVPGKRVTPATDAVNMPRIATPNTTSAITIAPGASFYRLVGLEVTSVSTQGCNPRSVPPVNCFTYSLVNAASTTGQPLVNSITVDRCYIHGSPTQDVREGVVANGSNFAVIDSYISDIHQSTSDSQAILAYFTPGPIKIVNNFLSATTEDTMFGGAGGKNNPYVPSDIEIRNNYFYKPLTWAVVGATLGPGNQWVEKNNLEFKSARRVIVDGNTMENTWLSGQMGFSVVLTVRSSQSGDISVVDDITITNNTLKNVGAGFNTLAHDDQCGNSTYPNCANPGETRRLKIYNNLILFRDPSQPGGVRNSGIQMSPGLTDVVLQHNTFVPATGTTCWNNVYFPVIGPWPPTTSITHNIWLLDNAFCRQPTGDWGAQGTTGLTYYMGDPAPLGARFYGNVMYVPVGDRVQTFPAHNYPTTVPLAYVNIAAGNYQLASPLWTDTSDGKPAGIGGAIQPNAGGGFVGVGAVTFKFK